MLYAIFGYHDIMKGYLDLRNLFNIDLNTKIVHKYFEKLSFNEIMKLFELEQVLKLKNKMKVKKIHLIFRILELRSEK